MLKTAFSFDVYANSDVGLVREHNEDVWKSDSQKGIFIVADGMGGHNCGEIASLLAAETTFAFLQKAETFSPLILKKAFEEANHLIYKKGKQEPSCHGMGTTLAALTVLDDVAFFAHVGDSRIYLFREEILLQLTKDHTLANESATNRKDDVNPRSLKHILTKAVGTHSKVEEAPGQIILKEHDILLLATDGLTNYVSDESLSIIISKKISIKEKGELLINLAKKHGGGDNITLILIAVIK